jgi:cyclopropane fatty-acyl-phospholipid synthase-like methyltransferase
LTHPATNIWRQLHQDNRYFDTHSRYQGAYHLGRGGMEAVAKYLTLTPNTTILDLGCGYGRLMYHLLPVAGEVWGYDIATEPLDKADKLLREQGLNWRLFLGDGQTLKPIRAKSVNAIFSLCVFQHLPRATAKSLVGDMRRVLRPGGKAAIQFLAGPSPADVDCSRAQEQSIQYTLAQIRELAESSGLTLEQIDHQDIGMAPLSYKWLVMRKVN